MTCNKCGSSDVSLSLDSDYTYNSEDDDEEYECYTGTVILFCNHCHSSEYIELNENDLC